MTTMTQTIRITPGPTVQTPRVVAIIEVLAQMMGAIWRTLESMGERRAAAMLREHARNCERYDPQRAQLLLDASRFSSSGRAEGGGS